MSPKFNKEDLLNQWLIHEREAVRLKNLAEQLISHSKSKELVMILALATSHDLYDSASSDEANCRRIMNGLEMAGDQLHSLASRLRDLNTLS